MVRAGRNPANLLTGQIKIALSYEILTTFLIATALLSLSPGPDNIYVLTQSMAYGKKYGLATTAGLMTGCLIHTTLLAFGVSVLIRENPLVLFTIKIFGALYLFYLAFRVYRHSDTIEFFKNVPKKGLWRLYRQGFVMNILNPKVTLFFLAFFPGFLFSDSISLVLQFYILGALFILVSFTVFGMIAVLADQIAAAIRHRKNTGIFLKWMQILIFVAIAAYLLLSKN